MDGYLDPDEEFELLYGDELDVLRETQENCQENVVSTMSTPNSENLQEIDQNKGASTIRILENIEITSRKRPLDVDQPVDDLFGDISDLSEDIQLPKAKKLKDNTERCSVEAQAVIEHIIELRNEVKQRNAMCTRGKNIKNYKFPQHFHGEGNLVAHRLPNYPFVPVTTTQGDRLYIRMHSEEFFAEECRKSSLHDESEEFTPDFDAIYAQALEADAPASIPFVIDAGTTYTKDLWVEVYKPRKYVDLLSDESTNRTLLRWIKLWDRAVFNKRSKLAASSSDFFAVDAEAPYRPKYKIALLAGAPGLGKTTLAHLLAAHAGYHAVEVNASDERNVDHFRQHLINATTMTTVVDAQRRPNCLIFDEIDGAPQGSIDFLLQFAADGYSSGKNKQRVKLLRPIICICNDAYVPSLRAMRSSSGGAFLIHFKPFQSSPSVNQRLTDRLMEVSRLEGLRVNRGTLMALVERAHQDIRCCLGVLQFFKEAQHGDVTLEDVLSSMAIGEKDVQRSLFDVWNGIFFGRRHYDGKFVLDAVNACFGEWDKLAMGVFENYPLLNVRDSTMAGAVEALEWFCLFDVQTRMVQETQNYALGQYRCWAFVLWHCLFGNYRRRRQQAGLFALGGGGGGGGKGEKIRYPSVGNEIRQRKQKLEGILRQLLRFISPTIRVHTTMNALKLDVLPIVQRIIINPALRPVNLHLFTANERCTLKNLIDIMIDYGLNYVQERNMEGSSYVFNLDPNIEDLVQFACCTAAAAGKTTSRRRLSDANRQLVAREIVMERMRRMESKRNNEMEKDDKCKGMVKVPNHLRKLTSKKIKIAANNKKDMQKSNFFALKIKMQSKCENHGSKSSDDSNTNENDENDERRNNVDIEDNGIYFQFKEGHTNAVKKHIIVAQLL